MATIKTLVQLSSLWMLYSLSDYIITYSLSIFSVCLLILFLPLQGNSDIDQLSKIFAAFGTPKADQWPDLTKLPDYVEYQFVPAPSLRSLFPAVSDDALDLLSKMFTYDPKARISIKQALEHRCVKFTSYL